MSRLGSITWDGAGLAADEAADPPPIGDSPRLIGLPSMGDIARAGALQVLWDLNWGTGPDAQEAAEAWLRWMPKNTVIV